jgi:hypothetical protein
VNGACSRGASGDCGLLGNAAGAWQFLAAGVFFDAEAQLTLSAKLAVRSKKPGAKHAFKEASDPPSISSASKADWKTAFGFTGIIAHDHRNAL